MEARKQSVTGNGLSRTGKAELQASSREVLVYSTKSQRLRKLKHPGSQEEREE